MTQFSTNSSPVQFVADAQAASVLFAERVSGEAAAVRNMNEMANDLPYNYSVTDNYNQTWNIRQHPLSGMFKAYFTPRNGDSSVVMDIARATVWPPE